ncbi:MAG: hypothetical protein ACYTG0_23650 [Planctomycetota bacterium]|jgi:hypothetical protein
MAKTPSVRLVIDASVAGRAGDRQRLHPAGKRCRDFLDEVRTVCHRVVMTPEIREEWRRHQFSFARKWRVRMFASRKVDSIGLDADDSIAPRLERLEASEKQRDRMLKDCLLIDAALGADGYVVSLDDKAKRLFRGASESLAELKRIVWVNPDRPEEDTITWLQDGAPRLSERMLGWRE